MKAEDLLSKKLTNKLNIYISLCKCGDFAVKIKPQHHKGNKDLFILFLSERGVFAVKKYLPQRCKERKVFTKQNMHNFIKNIYQLKF